jgi:hypothetical protein
MKTLEEKFIELKEKRPAWSDYLCFSNTVFGKGYTFAQIKDGFMKLVDKMEYSKGDLEEVLKDLYAKSLVGHL